jgi:hypothetical protein
VDFILDTILPLVFSEVSRKIRDHPLPANVRRLGVLGVTVATAALGDATKDVGNPLGSIGALDHLNLTGFDLRPYLDPFFDTPMQSN